MNKSAYGYFLEMINIVNYVQLVYGVNFTVRRRYNFLIHFPVQHTTPIILKI